MSNKLPFLPDDHHYAIANVACRAAQLDHHIELTVFCLMGQHTGSFVLKQLGHDRQVGLIRALTLDLFPEHADELCEILDEIIVLRKERNEIMHWLWGEADAPDVAKYSSIRPYRENPEPKIKTAQEIQKIADGMLGCTTDLLAYVDLELRKAGMRGLGGVDALWLDQIREDRRRRRLSEGDDD